MVDRPEVFAALCDARAKLWVLGEYDFHTAVDGCQAWAMANGLVKTIGQDAVQLIMARAFAAHRTDLGGWIP